ncbi:LOW QUALITY PROTEIN: hypothetical protein V1477_013923 [Vespula maculifrons]|uniref:Uncharacterized protein n=1 Tax=Vespula maculifrons TaxID=7453 RepID=A0ABD2BPP1_VESMC
MCSFVEFNNFLSKFHEQCFKLANHKDNEKNGNMTSTEKRESVREIMF